MIDPQMSLAFALRSDPGAYAALIGSGVSVGARDPRRLAGGAGPYLELATALLKESASMVAGMGDHGE